MSEPLSNELLDLLVCPIDRQTLAYIPSESILYNPRLKKSYEIRNGIPVLLVDEASDVDDDLHNKYIDGATHYTGPRQTHTL